MLARNGERPAETAISNGALVFVHSGRNGSQTSSRATFNFQARREEADDYPNVICELNDHWRIIVCRDNVQWVLQRRRGVRRGQSRWDGRSYVQTRSALNRVVRSFAGDVVADALRVITRLPERIGGGQ